ncbi:MAG: alpha/beta hydrolase, partial [Acidobacteria bacterium]|nr:alpha/beta hydrolase [Acidobacteriota bacterium]
PDAQMTVIPGAGHSPHLERPDEFAARLQDFIAQLTPDAENASKAATQWEQLKSAVVRWLDIR